MSPETIQNWGVAATLKFEYARTPNSKKNQRPEIQPESGKNKQELDFEPNPNCDDEASQSFLFDLNETKSNCDFNFREKDEHLLIYPRNSRLLLQTDSANFSKINNDVVLEGECFADS